MKMAEQKVEAMDDKAASKFQSMAVRTMFLKITKYSLVVCAIAYFAGSAWWLLLMLPSLPLAILRTNAQVGTGAYMSKRGKYLSEKRKHETTSYHDMVNVEPARELEEYISQVDYIIDHWGAKELILTTQIGNQNFMEKCALFYGEGFDNRIKPTFIALTTIDAAKILNERGQEFAFDWFDSMRENIGDFKQN